mmetsp:Transcript_45238/g.72755  ORF Transcript_45238/g.72755 Transcript_45238/m.72755 type:complete len:104 (+) Transcript_45238:107-418(+)
MTFANAAPLASEYIEPCVANSTIIAHMLCPQDRNNRSSPICDVLRVKMADVPYRLHAHVATGVDFDQRDRSIVDRKIQPALWRQLQTPQYEVSNDVAMANKER